MATQRNVCIKHKMADGTIMDGPTHGPNQECIEWADGYKKGGKIINPLYKGKLKKTARHYSAGGMLVGPSHEQGGIPVLVDGNEPIEVEGGEFIINKQTVNAVGEEFLHKLNSTETTHHDGGFNEGELPGPSRFKDGGKVNNRRSEMARGRRAPRRGIAPAKRRMARGGNVSPSRGRRGRASRMTPTGRGKIFRGGGRTTAAGRKTMRTRPVAKYPHGGMHNNAGMGNTHYAGTNTSCVSYSSDITTCNHTAGCHYDYQRDMCVGR